MGYTVLSLLLVGLVISDVAFSAVVTIGGMKQDFLAFHNKARAQHVDTCALEWNSDLAKDAETYAVELTNSGKFQHSSSNTRPWSGGVQGENLFTGNSVVFQTQPVSLCMTLWYEEGNRFAFNKAFLYNFKGIGALGHFTAMVWRDTTQVGCGGAYKDTPKGRVTNYVCRYTPQGNIPGNFHKKVMKLKAGFEFPSKDDKSFFKSSGFVKCENAAAWNNYCVNTVAKFPEFCEKYKDSLDGNCDKTCGKC